MIRTPLRPLARILEARQKGENPDAIERENKRIRHEQMRDASRQRAEGRLLVLGVFFFCAFTVVGARMGVMATTDPTEPRAAAPGSVISATRADIVDRNGNLLATNFETHALYAQPHHMIDPQGAVKKLMAVFPDLNEERLLRDFTGKRKFLWIKKKISPEQMQAVHDIGEPGLLFAPRDMRLYPNGSLAAHIMGGASYGREGVHAAEVIGVAGAEKYFDDYLRDPANGNKPLELSIDMTVQAASERILYGGMKLMNAKGATSVLMDVHTGEVISAQEAYRLGALEAVVPRDQLRPAAMELAAKIAEKSPRAVRLAKEWLNAPAGVRKPFCVEPGLAALAGRTGLCESTYPSLYSRHYFGRLSPGGVPSLVPNEQSGE